MAMIILDLKQASRGFGEKYPKSYRVLTSGSDFPAYMTERIYNRV